MMRFRFYISLFTFGLIVLISGCKHRIDQQTVVISGRIVPSENFYLTLIRVDTSSFTPVDSVKPGRNGDFSVDLKLPMPGIYQLQYKGKILAPLVLHPGDRINLGIRNDTVDVTGGLEAGRFNTFRNKIKTCEEIVDSLGTVLNLARDFENYALIRAGADSAYYKLMRRAKADGIAFIRANPVSLSQLMVMNSKVQQAFIFDQTTDSSWFFYTDSALLSQYPRNPHVIANHIRISKLRFSVNQERSARANMQTGKKAPALILPGLNGKPVDLNPAKNKYTLVYFWAPNDGPSRKAGQELKNLYDQYKSLGLEVFAVSFDQYTERWKAAVNLDKLWWINVNDTLLLNSKVAESWYIQKLPVFVLIDRQGKIIERFPAVRQLTEWLALKAGD